MKFYEVLKAAWISILVIEELSGIGEQKCQVARETGEQNAKWDNQRPLRSTCPLLVTFSAHNLRVVL